MKRWYIENLGYSEYPIDAIIQHLKLQNGVKFISSANKFYWSNQPRVITFRADHSTIEVIGQWLPRDLRVRLHWKEKQLF